MSDRTGTRTRAQRLASFPFFLSSLATARSLSLQMRVRSAFLLLSTLVCCGCGFSPPPAPPATDPAAARPTGLPADRHRRRRSTRPEKNGVFFATNAPARPHSPAAEFSCFFPDTTNKKRPPPYPGPCPGKAWICSLESSWWAHFTPVGTSRAREPGREHEATGRRNGNGGGRDEVTENHSGGCLGRSHLRMGHRDRPARVGEDAASAHPDDKRAPRAGLTRKRAGTHATDGHRRQLGADRCSPGAAKTARLVRQSSAQGAVARKLTRPAPAPNAAAPVRHSPTPTQASR